ncbi:MAG: hypothetical protein WA737_01830 [Candidatus Acidiferrales bacterium]
MMETAQTDDHAAHQSSPKIEHPALFTGLYTGVLLVIVMAGALVAANRIPGLEHYALERNAASYTLFVLLMLIPVVRFLRRPGLLFASAMVGWTLLVVAYDIAGMFLHSLFEVLRTPLEVLIEGAIIYGVIAVGSWVGGMMMHMRHHSIVSARRRAHDVHHAHHEIHHHP